ncbi:MAG: helix-turn-helix domain-containing protein [Candidatus Methanoplasma sp.]|jgi:predicted transcriptional regulator|nr:helix-turn-helix domain-containing protein [Candidatus Methanoplasma sp.]
MCTLFELQVVSNTPMNTVTDKNIVAETFLVQIGYIPKGYDPKTSATGVRDSVPYRLFVDFFMKNTNKAWAVEELSALLNTTKPTIYRHINKLKSMDLLESIDVEFDGAVRKGYRIRYGDLAKAWSFTEANVNMAMENYRRTASHFQSLSRAEDE